MSKASLFSSIDTKFPAWALINLRTSKWIKQTIFEGPQPTARLIAKAFLLPEENEGKKPVRI